MLNTLPRLPIHDEIKRNKQLLSSDTDIRHKVFCERFVDKSLPREAWIPKEIYYPTSDMSDVINEIVSQFPSDLTISGKEAEFLKENLIEYSFLQEALNKVWAECFLGIDAYMLVKPKISTNKDFSMKFEFEVIPSEKVWEETDILTGEPKVVITEEIKDIFNAEKSQYQQVKIRKTYTLDTIKTEIENINGSSQNQETLNENPFKSLGMLPIIRFKGISDSNGMPVASKLRMKQLDLDNLNTNIQNMINLNASPLWAITKTNRSWDGIAFGAGQTIALTEDEDIKAIYSQMQLDALNKALTEMVDRIYKSAGLIPMSLRDKVYSTDSSRVAKMAANELIGQIRDTLNSTRISLDDIIKIALFLNGKKYTDEAFVVPQELLPVDLDSAFNTWAIGMNLGIVDDELFWKRYMPDLQNEEKERIKEAFKARQEEAMAMQAKSDLMKSGTNVDNRAKMGKPSGRKERNTKLAKGSAGRDGYSTQK